MRTNQLPAPLRSLFYEPPGATDRDWVTDGIITAAVAFFTLTFHALPLLRYGPTADNPLGPRYGSPLLVLLAGALFVAPLVLRRHYPLLMTLGVTLAGLMLLVVSAFPPAPVVIVPIVTYSVARLVPGLRSRWVLVAGFMGSVLGPARWLYTLNQATAETFMLYVLAVTVCMFTVVTPYAIGRRIQENEHFTQSQHERELALHMARLEQSEQRARMAEIAARQTIAQELHDIVAHSLSVMIVQAEGGRALAVKKPEAAVTVLDTIAETGREALGEMRRIVGVLRDDEHTADYGPQPSLEDLPEMVRRAGDRVQLRVTGQPYPVSSAVSLTVFRVVQEAVTNVLKHAGPDARAWVSLVYAPGSIEAQVRDDGAGSQAGNDGQGNGLRGMRERVASVGGRLMARPSPEGGFIVRISVPTRKVSS